MPITFYTGTMFAGKTKKLIELYNKSNNAIAFKPKLDNRYSEDKIVSHNGDSIEAFQVETIIGMCGKIGEEGHFNKFDNIFIDEIQFFHYQDIIILIPLSQELSNINFHLFGLSTDYKRNFFPTSQEIYTNQKYINIIQLESKCDLCNNKAKWNKRLSDSKELIELGNSNKYSIRCKVCFDK